MITKLIAIAMVAAVVLGSWQLFLYYERVRLEEEATKAESAQAAVRGDLLPGVPYALEASLRAAREQGATGLGNWLKNYGASIEDPRRAWIELDYVVLISRSRPAEARQLFASIRDRTPPDSPVWPRIKQLEQTYQ